MERMSDKDVVIVMEVRSPLWALQRCSKLKMARA